jgi:hypothetical protein
VTASTEGPGPVQPVARGALSAPPDVVAAIASAIDACWPRPAPRGRGPGPGHPQERGGPEYVWRFSGRWWSKPLPLRRDRPWTVTHGEHGQVGTEGA